MRRTAFIITLLVMSSIISIMIPGDTEGIGPVTIGVMISLDYPGHDSSDPVDLSTGYFGNDPSGDPVEERWIQIHGSLEATSQLTHIIQDVEVKLSAEMTSEIFGTIKTDMYFQPELLIFSELLPLQGKSQNFSLYILLDEEVPAGKNTVEISGRWRNQPGGLSGDIGINHLPLYILPVTSAFFEQTGEEVTLDRYDTYRTAIGVIVNGNDFTPPIDIRIEGEDDANDIDVTISYTITSESTGNSLSFRINMDIVSDGSVPGDSVDLSLVLYDMESGMDLDTYYMEIEIEAGYVSPPQDDDDPPVVDELWTFDQCERTYTDEIGDDLTLWTSVDKSLNIESGAEVNTDPRVDIKMFRSYRENDNLVIEIEMQERSRLGILDSGIWNPYIYFLDPAKAHVQPVPDLSEGNDLSEQDYEPPQAVVSTSIFHSSVFWAADVDVKDNKYVITGSIDSLMEAGLDLDFNLFVKITFIDMSDFSSENSINFRATYDYAGEGAWIVDPDVLPRDSIRGEDPDDPGGNLLLYVIAGIIAIALFVIVISFMIIRRKKR